MRRRNVSISRLRFFSLIVQYSPSTFRVEHYVSISRLRFFSLIGKAHNSAGAGSKRFNLTLEILLADRNYFCSNRPLLSLSFNLTLEILLADR